MIRCLSVHYVGGLVPSSKFNNLYHLKYYKKKYKQNILLVQFRPHYFNKLSEVHYGILCNFYMG